MTLAMLPILQPLNSTKVEPKASINSNSTDDNSFSKTFDAAFEANKVNPASGNGKDQNKMLNSNESNGKIEENVKAKDFLKKIGLQESDIQNILQASGLSQDIALIDFLKSFNNQMTDLDDLMATPFKDFLGQLGLAKEKIEKIAQSFNVKTESANQTAINVNKTALSAEEKPVISVKNLLQEAGVLTQKNVTTKGEDLPANTFLKNVGLDKNESSTLMKELGITQQTNDKTADSNQKIKVADLLGKMGLNSDEISKVIEKRFESASQKEALKNMLLNKDINGLKQLALTEKNQLNFSEKINTPVLVQAGNQKVASEVFTGKNQPETVLSSTVIKENFAFSPQTSTSGHGMNMNNDASGFAAQLTKTSNEMQSADLKFNELAPKSFFERTVVDQIVSKVNFNMTMGKEEMRIHLEPPSLGSLNMKVSVDGKVVSATIIADNNLAKEIIQSNIQQLIDSMSNQGLKLDNLSVLLGGDGSKNMDNFRSLMSEEKTNQLNGSGDDNNDNPMNQNSENLLHYAGSTTQTGVDLFI